MRLCSDWTMHTSSSRHWVRRAPCKHHTAEKWRAPATNGFLCASDIFDEIINKCVYCWHRICLFPRSKKSASRVVIGYSGLNVHWRVEVWWRLLALVVKACTRPCTCTRQHTHTLTNTLSHQHTHTNTLTHTHQHTHTPIHTISHTQVDCSTKVLRTFHVLLIHVQFSVDLLACTCVSSVECVTTTIPWSQNFPRFLHVHLCVYT